MQGRNNFENIGKFSDDLFEVKDSFNLETHFISSNGLIHTNFLKPSKFKPKKWEFRNYFVFDKDIYFREYNYQNFYAYQIIIPSISEIYPLDDLIFNNKNQGKFYRDFVLNYKKYNKNEIIEAFEGFNPYMDLGKFIGVIFEENLTILEFIKKIKNDKLQLKISNKYKNINFIRNKIVKGVL